MCLADKLIMDADTTVTFYLDPHIDNSFMSNIANDLQCVTDKDIVTIDNQVQLREGVRTICFGRLCYIITIIRVHSTPSISILIMYSCHILSVQNWSSYDYVVLPNLNIFSSHNDSLYAETVRTLFR